MADMQPDLARRNATRSVGTFTGWTIVLMVVLRIAIGWHFFYEGVWKLDQEDWRATGYLANSMSPFRPLFRDVMVNDPNGYKILGIDESTIDKDDNGRVIDVQFSPENMNEKMDEIAEAAIEHYRLNDEQKAIYLTFVERKKHGFNKAYGDEHNLDLLFDREDFARLLKEGKVKRAEALARLQPMFDDLDARFVENGRRMVPELFDGKDLSSLDKVVIVPPDAPTVDEDDLSWLTRGYLHELLDKRYDQLTKYYFSFPEGKYTDEQRVDIRARKKKFNESTWGTRWRDVKKYGDLRDRNYVDNIWGQRDREIWEKRNPDADPKTREKTAFELAVINYVDICEQIKDTEEAAGLYGRPARDYEWERLKYDWQKRRKAQLQLMAVAEIPLRDIDPMRIDQRFGNAVGEFVGLELTEDQLKQGGVQLHPSQTAWIDQANMYALTIFGACLILGLFTRVMAFCAAGLLLSFYFCMPPWPGYEANMTAEGHALIINKNLIEAIALLTIVTTRVGRWAGLDGIIAGIIAVNKPQTQRSAVR